MTLRELAKELLMFTCLMIVAGCIAAGIGLIYTAGQVNGLNKGYALGMKVADVYKQRAEECKGTASPAAVVVTPTAATTTTRFDLAVTSK